MLFQLFLVGLCVMSGIAGVVDILLVGTILEAMNGNAINGIFYPFIWLLVTCVMLPCLILMKRIKIKKKEVRQAVLRQHKRASTKC